MSAGCAPSEIRAECAARRMSPARTQETFELIEAMVAGHYDGKDRSTPDEPQRPPSSQKQPPPDNDPLLELIDPHQIAEQALRTIEPALGAWKASYLAQHEEAAQLLTDLGLIATDLYPRFSLEQQCQRLAERPISATPDYFSPLLIQFAAEEMLTRILTG